MTEKKTPNKKRGEVGIEIDGEMLIFCAYMPRVAAITEELETNDIYKVREMFFPGRAAFLKALHEDEEQGGDEPADDVQEDEILNYFDIRVTYICAKHLCISHKPEELSEILRYQHLHTVGFAILSALFSGLSDEDEKEEREDKPVKKSKGSADKSTKN